MAAHVTDRICFGLEIQPRYVDMAVMRWQKLTGKNAVLEGDGRSFQQMAVARRPIAEEVEDVAA